MQFLCSQLPLATIYVYQLLKLTSHPEGVDHAVVYAVETLLHVWSLLWLTTDVSFTHKRSLGGYTPIHSANADYYAQAASSVAASSSLDIASL